MKQPFKHLLAILALTISGMALANDISTRANRWETTLQLRQNESSTTSFSNGSEFKMDSSLGWGLGFAYNLNQNFSLGFDFSSANVDYTRTSRDSAISSRTFYGSGYVSTFGLTGTYNIFDRAFTPYITGKVGSTYFDSGIANGETYCYGYPYPYYGTCYADTYSRYEMTYGGGVGVRWEMGRSFFVKGGVDRTYIDVNTANGTPKIDTWRLDLGLVF